tara:strand:- start:3914 stop:4147 length:234 start_codon:yes stop_codon:yes gene_type:complete
MNHGDMARIEGLLQELLTNVATLTERVGTAVKSTADQETRIRALEVGRYKLAGIMAAVNLVVVPVAVALAIKAVKAG